MAGPLFIDTSGWRLAAGHFAERHGLIIIVALGESIVAIGVGAEAGVDGGVIAAAILGIAVACAFWWTYFDVAALMAARRLAEVESVQVRNELARDAFSYLHLPMVAAIVLVALGMKVTLAHVGDPLNWEAATALVGGAALYLLAHVAFKLRSLGSFSVERLAAAFSCSLSHRRGGQPGCRRPSPAPRMVSGSRRRPRLDDHRIIETVGSHDASPVALGPLNF